MNRDNINTTRSGRFDTWDTYKRFRPQRPLAGVRPNISALERRLSVIGGSLMALTGLSRGTLSGLAWTALGGNLIYRGIRGYSSLYSAMGIDTARRRGGPSASVPHGRGIQVERTVTINRSAEDLYSFWRNFENLPKILSHVEAVQITDPSHSHWVIRGPAQMRIAWDAELINDQRPELIAWRSLANADVDHAGSVHFRRAPGGRGTELRVILRYDPPGGKVTDAFARLVQADPATEIEEDLRNFKQVMEAGEIAHVEQPVHYGVYA